MATKIDRGELQKLVAGGARLVEVLAAKEYAEDHLPGAVSMPLRRLEMEAELMDPKHPVIVYCWDAA